MSGINDEKIYQPMTEKANDKAIIQFETVHYGDYREHPGIKKVRILLLVLLAIEMIFAVYQVFSYVGAMFRYGSLPEEYKNDVLHAWLIRKLLGAFVGVFYLAVFIFMVVRYVRVGILVFAWLSLIQLIAIGLIVIISVISVMAVSASADKTGVGLFASAMIVLIVGLISLMTIFIVVFSFKMAKLLKAQENNPLAARPIVAL